MRGDDRCRRRRLRPASTCWSTTPGAAADFSRLEHKTDADWSTACASALIGAFWAMQAVFPHMRRQALAGASSRSARSTASTRTCTRPNTTRAKEALRALTRTAAREWARHGILRQRRSARPRSPRRTRPSAPSTRSSRRALLTQNPMGRMGDPERTSRGVALFLASDDARYVTGNTIFVDGGCAHQRRRLGAGAARRILRAGPHGASVSLRSPRARPARGAQPGRRPGQGLVALQQRQGRHRAPARAGDPHARQGAAARAAAARAVDRVEQRAAVPHPRVGLSRRPLPARHRGGGARHRPRAHPPPGDRPCVSDPRRLSPAASAICRAPAAFARRAARRASYDVGHPASLALLQPRVVVAAADARALPRHPRRRPCAGSRRRDPRRADGQPLGAIRARPPGSTITSPDATSASTTTRTCAASAASCARDPAFRRRPHRGSRAAGCGSALPTSSSSWASSG